MKKKLVISGEVHEVGYRPFLLGIAESLEIERFFADNTKINGKKAVYVLVDSTLEKVESFVEIVKAKYPESARVESITVEDYKGSVMKTENYYRYLSAMQLSKIATYGGKMLEKMDTMLGKQDEMLAKQDEHIELTKEILRKQDEHIELTKEILSKQDEHIDITKEILHETKHISAKQEEQIEMARKSVGKLDSISRAEMEIKKLREEFQQLKEAIRKAGIEV